MTALPPAKAICIEDLGAVSPSARYLRCVALPGRQPGLGLSGSGTVVWRDDERMACELWVSADERLIVFRRESSPPLTVRRAGRSLSAPAGKPIVLIDGDELLVAARHVRIHVHGIAPDVVAPSPLPVRSGAAARMTAVAAAAVALSAATGCERIKTTFAPDAGIEVRETPPEPLPIPEPNDVSDAATEEITRPDAASSKGKTEGKAPIEVRNTPPDPWE